MSALPSRRDEGWRWSDLRSAVPEGAPLGEGAHVLERLAAGQGRAARVAVPAGETKDIVIRLGSSSLEAEALDVELGEGARLTRTVFQSGDGVALSFVRARLGPGARFHQFVVGEGAAFARIETEVVIEGEGADVQLHGVYLAGPGRHCDLTSRIAHRAEGGTTVQLVKGAAKARGRGVFQGKIEVAKGAQRTDARQNHHALLLDEGAEVDAKPELEIWADDVQCAHGNTVGGLSADQLFFMRARGLPEAEARALLTQAFLVEAIPAWLSQELQDEASNRIRAWLSSESAP